jgi:anthranilate phosphoribosyltransferase
VTVSGDSAVWDVTDGDVRLTKVDPLGAGVSRYDATLLAGGDAARNAQLLREVLAGSQEGPLEAIRTAVLLNAGLALVVWDAAVGQGRFGAVTDPAISRLGRAVPVAAESIDSGRAGDVLRRWVEVSVAHAG